VATGISDDGRTIVGEGINPDGNNEAWRAELTNSNVVPEPSAIAVWSLLCGIGLVVQRGRKRKAA
jgi:hypothetical protein